MKKQVVTACLVLAVATVMTGCTWEDFKAKFVGEESVSSGSAVSGGSAEPIEIEDYDPNECVTLAEYKGVEVDCTVSKAEIYSNINSMLSSSEDVKKIKKGTCKEGDYVNADCEGKVDGKAFDGGTVKEQSFTLGSSEFSEAGLDEKVAGMEIGTKKDINVKFPEDYEDNPALAGKDAVFTVKVNYVLRPDKAFLKKNTQYKTLEEYEKTTEENLKKQKEESVGTTALQTVIKKSTVNYVPATLKEAEKGQMDAVYRAQIQGQLRMDLETYLQQTGQTEETWDAQLEASAEESAGQRLVIEAIAAKEGIEISDDELEKYINNMLTKAKTDRAGYEKQYTDYMGTTVSFEDYMRFSATFDQVVEIVEKNAKVKK